MLTRAAVLALLAALAAAVPASPAAAAERCPHGAQCAQLSVPLDHTGATAGSLKLAYARIPATGTRLGTIVALTGGPGQPGIPFASDLAKELRPLKGSYDLVVPDVRGTGDSSAVHCGSVDTAAEVTACGNKLGGLRPFLSTAETAEDLENLRGALGVDKLTLYGVSYGTKVAAEYARRFPAQTAGLILDSAVPVDGLDATSQLPQLAFTRMLTEVCHPAACRRTVRNPGGALTRAATRVRSRLVEGPVVAPHGVHRTVPVSQRLLYAVLANSDLSPALRSGLPAALQSLAHGDAAPFLHLATLPNIAGAVADLTLPRVGDASAGDVNTARFLATSCIEGRLPWDPAAPVAGRTDALHAFGAAQAGAFAPFNAQIVLSLSTANLCASWPPTPVPAAVPVAGPDVPVLVLSGRDDLRTPLEDATKSAQAYPHAQLLDVPDVGHDVLGSDFTDCAQTAVVDFLAGKVVQKCHEREAIPPAGFLPATIAHLRPLSAGGRAGRTFRAVELSFAGIQRDSVLRLFAGAGAGPVPGVRAGWARLTKKRLTLHGYSLFRGMRITGTLTKAGGAMTVSGGGAADGRLTFARGGRISGVLGGVTVRRR